MVAASVLKLLVVVLDVCGHGFAVRPRNLHPVLFGKGVSLQSMFEQCSFNATRVSAKDSLVVPSLVPVPCTGYTSSGEYFASHTCPFSAWGDYAMSYVADTLGVDVTGYTNQVVIVPKCDVCSWGGMGWIGCNVGRPCRTWISGDLWHTPVPYFHEIGHNLGLNHAGVAGDNGYGDLSSAMGYCCDQRCYSAAHAHLLNWTRPLATFDGSALQPGQWWSFQLPPAASTKKNHILISFKQRGTRSGRLKLFISWRKNISIDSGLNPDFANRVLVHSSGVDVDDAYSSLETRMQANQVFVETRLGTLLNVRTYGMTNAQNKVRVDVCRSLHPAGCTI